MTSPVRRGRHSRDYWLVRVFRRASGRHASLKTVRVPF
jgi:hypothetical protein